MHFVFNDGAGMRLMAEGRAMSIRPKKRIGNGRRTFNPDAATVVDLFCGVGGLSHGFHLEGMKVAAGIDLDRSCKFAFEVNNNAKFLCEDVSNIEPRYLRRLFGKGPTVLVGCAPCQPFSSYAAKFDNPDWKLLQDFASLIVKVRPDVVSMENVPRLVDFQKGRVFKAFVKKLRDAGYHVSYQIVYAPDYGVPQRRSRLVLLASRHGKIELINATHSKAEHVTVRDAIGALPRLKAGAANRRDPLHRCSGLSPLNLKRIRAATAGGSWKDWRKNLITPCHKAKSGKTYVSVYGRMSWDAPSPTVTTQFFGFGNGRFGHPSQDRAISLREGAILQSFPPTYRFIDDDETVEMKRLGRLIGNAVPVLLGRAIARSIKLHLRSVSAREARKQH